MKSNYKRLGDYIVSIKVRNSELKAKELLGWEAKVNRAEGMKITYDYFKSLSSEELLKEEHKDFSKYIK